MSTVVDQKQKEATAQFVWTAIILAFFIIQAIVWILAISFTVGDMSNAVVKGYDERSLKWDQFRTLRDTSDSLGWQTSIEMGDDANVRAERTLTLSLTDRNGHSVTGAIVEIVAFHVGRAAEKQTLRLAETSPGSYTAKLRVSRTGHWQFSGTAERATEINLIELRQFISTKDK